MNLLLKPEDSGLLNYCDSTDCPIARTLSREGLKDVIVHHTTWEAKKRIWCLPFLLIKVEGLISPKARQAAIDWANHKCNYNRFIELPDPRIILPTFSRR